MRCDPRPQAERIAARDPDRQTAETHIRVALMNRFSALGTAEIVRVARRPQGKGKSRLKHKFCNNAHLFLYPSSNQGVRVLLPSEVPGCAAAVCI